MRTLQKNWRLAKKIDRRAGSGWVLVVRIACEPARRYCNSTMTVAEGMKK
jgi:hypothetical protein